MALEIVFNNLLKSSEMHKNVNVNVRYEITLIYMKNNLKKVFVCKKTSKIA